MARGRSPFPIDALQTNGPNMAATLLTIEPVSSHLGAEVSGLRLRDMINNTADKVFVQLRAALDEHLVLLFRNQELWPGELVRFAQMIGSGPFVDLKRANNPAAVHIPEHPDIKVISNGSDREGRPLGDVSDSLPQIWHSDGAGQDVPTGITTFYARQAPVPPPHTKWLNMYRVFDTMPTPLRRAAVGLQAIHWMGARSASYADFERPLPASEAQRRVGARHPLIRLHPLSLRPFLFVPLHRDTLIVDRSVEESRRIMSGIWDHVLASKCTWSHGLAAGDVAVWDNRVTMHGRDGWDSGQTRTMWHLATKGETPIAASAEVS